MVLEKWKIKVLFGRLVTAVDKARIKYSVRYNTDTSVKRTVIGSVPLVSVLKRFDGIMIFLPLSKLKRLNDLRLFIVFCSTLHCTCVVWLYTVMLFTCKGRCNLDISQLYI